jgi:thioredoxin 1
MATIEVTESNFEETVKEGGIVFIDFWASWCAPCRAFAPTFEAAAARHPDITFGKVNTEEQPRLAGSFQISAIPTLMVIRDGVILAMQPGALPPRSLEELIEKERAVDMQEVERELAREVEAAPAAR